VRRGRPAARPDVRHLKTADAAGLRTAACYHVGAVRKTVLPLACLFVVTGCVHRPAVEAPVEAGPTVETRAPEPSATREIAVGDDGDDEDEDERDDEGAPNPAVAVPLARTGRPSRRDPLFFALGAGYGALGRVDLTPCRAQGLPPGYLRLRVTFHASGRVVRAAVQGPTSPPDEALTCVGEQLEAMMVPLFEGDDVTLSKIVFVN